MEEKNKELSIIVTGYSATGKSAIAHWIFMELLKQGFEVDMAFENNYDFKDEVDFRKKMSINQSERLNAIKAKTKIKIKEVQAVYPIFSKNDEKA